MDLTASLRRRCVPRPLLVSVPGATAVRWAVESELRVRGWSVARSAAEADLLLECGTPGPMLAEAVQRVWDTVPAPCAWISITDATGLGGELDRAAQRLADANGGRLDTVGRVRAVGGKAEHADHGQPEGHPKTDPTAAGDGDTSSGHAMPGEHMSGHAMNGEHTSGHAMHGGEVAGLPMADRAPDRDGLSLDRVHLSLGPVLAYWPAGLAVRLGLQGDVVQEASVELIEPVADPIVPGPPAAVALDDLSTLLGVCGWMVAARTARRLRDQVVAGAIDRAILRRFVRQVGRSRTLRWATDGLGTIEEGSDATSRWRRWLEVAASGLRHPESGGVVAQTLGPQVLPDLLVGRELGAVRVVVASFGSGVAAGMAPRWPS